MSLDERAVGCRASVRARVDTPESVIGGVCIANEGFVRKVVESDRLFAGKAMCPWYQEHPRLLVQDRHTQLVGRERLSGDDCVHTVIQQSRMHIAPVQMQGMHLGVGTAAA
jgi:hypothetical protein